METTITKRDNGSRRVKQETIGKSRTEQNHRKECNINTIVAKAHKTGLFPQRQDVPRYGDFTGAGDFHEVQDRLLNANNDFMSLPSDIRNRFDNDAGLLLDFINDPDNLEEAQELGLIARPEHEAIVPPEATPEPEKASEPAADPEKGAAENS